MPIKKYAFITKIEENSWEVFHIERVDTEATPIVAELWLDAFSSGETITGVNATGKINVAHKSTWDGSNFTLPDPFPNHWKMPAGIPLENPDGTPIASFVLCRNNKVFHITSSIATSFYSQKFTAAFDNDVSCVEVQDGEVVALGQLWDGSNWILSSGQ